MGEANSPTAVLLLLAAFSRYCEALAWARQRACETWGPVALESPVFEFTHTDYYQAAMGPGLRKVFLLTTQTSDFFLRLGFKEVPVSELPASRRKTWNPERNSKVFLKTV